MHERHDQYLLWTRHPHAARAGPLPHALVPASEQRRDRRWGLRPLAWRRRLTAGPAGSPSAAAGGTRPQELDIHAYLELEFAVDDEQSRAGWGR